MSRTVLIRPNNMPSTIDKALGFDKYEEGRFPGTKVSMPLFKFSNGTYRHGVPEGSEDRKIIEKHLLNGSDLDSPEGRAFLSSFLIETGSAVDFLNLDNPEDLLKYYGLMATPDLIASSRKNLKEKAAMSNRFYVLEEYGEDDREKLTIKMKANKAKYKLVELDSTPDFMVALAQYLAPSNAGIKTQEDAYIFLDRLLDGDYTDGSQQVGINRFESALRVSPEKIVVSSIVKEAIYKNIIRKLNGVYTNPASKTNYGRTEEEVVNYLIDDANQEELGMDTPTDKPYSVRYLLKHKDHYKQK